MGTILFFDTETTGLPINYNAPISDIDNWPRIVQLSWVICNGKRDILKQADYVIKPCGFVIPTESSKIHGITNESALLNGSPINSAIKEFMSDVQQSDILVGHNIDFDINIICAEMYRLGMNYNQLTEKLKICTMKTGKDCCKFTVYGKSDYRYPKLQELYTKLYGESFENSHNSLSDTLATFKCFWKLWDLKYIPGKDYLYYITPDDVRIKVIKDSNDEGLKYLALNDIQNAERNFLAAAYFRDGFAQSKLAEISTSSKDKKYWCIQAINNGYLELNKNLSDIYKDEGNNTLAIKYIRIWEKYCLEKINKGEYRYIEILAEYYLCYRGLLYDYDKAYSLYAKGEELGIPICMCKLISENIRKKNIFKAILLIKKAIPILKEKEEYELLLDCYNNICRIYFYASSSYPNSGIVTKYDLALEYGLEAIRLYDEIGDRAIPLNYVGICKIVTTIYKSQLLPNIEMDEAVQQKIEKIKKDRRTTLSLITGILGRGKSYEKLLTPETIKIIEKNVNSINNYEPPYKRRTDYKNLKHKMPTADKEFWWTCLILALIGFLGYIIFVVTN